MILGVDIGKAVFGDVVNVNIKQLEKASTAAVTYAGKNLRARLQLDTMSTLGPRVANAWGQGVYPKGEPSMSAASLVYSKAPDIIRAFDQGSLIQPKGTKRYLPIPTAFNRTGSRLGRTSKAKGNLGQWVGVRVTPAEMMASKLAFIVRRPGRNPVWMLKVLVAQRRTKSGKQIKPMFVAGGLREVGTGKGQNSKATRAKLNATRAVPMFTLLPYVKVRKLLDNERRSQEAIGDLVQAFTTYAALD